MDAFLTNDSAMTYIVAIVLMFLLAIAALAFMFFTAPLPFLAVSLPVFALGLVLNRYRFGYWPELMWWRLWAVLASLVALFGPGISRSPLGIGAEISIAIGCFVIVEGVIRLIEQLEPRFGPIKLRKARDQNSEAPIDVPVSEGPQKPVFGRRSSPPRATYWNLR